MASLSSFDLVLTSLPNGEHRMHYRLDGDFFGLFETSLITSQHMRLRHFKSIRLVATSVDVYREMIEPHEIIITPANREDIILATLSKQWELNQQKPKQDLGAGLVLTGEHPPRHFIIEQIQKAGIPKLYTSVHSHV
ncbi:MAG: DRTGG domain-containing protein, partial [Bacteroidia bacterium]